MELVIEIPDNEEARALFGSADSFSGAGTSSRCWSVPASLIESTSSSL